MNIQSFIEQQKQIVYQDSVDSNLAVNILYNIICLNIHAGLTTENYKLAKLLMHHYVVVIRSEDYGYDRFNYSKLAKVIESLSYDRQIALLDYSLSLVSKELPEFDNDWFVGKRKICEINKIFGERHYSSYPKAILLSLSLDLCRLLLSLFILFFATCFILLPAPFPSWVVFRIDYEPYSVKFALNHFLNTLTIFADIDNDFKIKPIMWYGVLLQVVGKMLYVILIANFAYGKISDKIRLK